MKKRSILALATLATGFVVAAVTPSHAAGSGSLDDLHVSDTLHTAGDLVGQDAPAPADEGPLGRQ
ncbi:hypothetical protein [Streptomyces sp. AF1A]|jgi:hypothetical protein|uniref:hypothetical protein n=1 Tax=Streptomyces sp. AF1A TaxID=3394350 RepID=UPI0039BD0C7F